MATNQRILKFRAWDNQEKKMYRVIALSLRKDGTCGASIYTGVITRTLPDCEIMQFTGLLDKNGKEIYEGDILKFNFARKGEKSSVEWNNESCTYVLEPVHTTLLWMNEESSLEVIGDIYTTPELLAK